MLFAARAAAREGFKNARDAEPEEARGMVSHALDVAKILRENVVQGKQVEDGSYREYSTPPPPPLLRTCVEEKRDLCRNPRAANTRAHGAWGQREHQAGEGGDASWEGMLLTFSLQ